MDSTDAPDPARPQAAPGEAGITPTSGANPAGAPGADAGGVADNPEGTDAQDSSAAQLLNSAVDPSTLPPPTESMRLLGAAQAGDREAMQALLQRYEARLMRIVRIRISARLRGSIESMDVMQETWRAAVQHIGDLHLHEPADILRWLARIAENHMLDVNRRLTADRRDKRREVPLSPAGDSQGSTSGFQLSAPGSSPVEAASEREMRRIVDEAVAELPEDYREVIVLRTYHGGSWDFVAKAMGSTSSEAARLLHRRARIRLARMLRGRLGDALSSRRD